MRAERVQEGKAKGKQASKEELHVSFIHVRLSAT